MWFRQCGVAPGIKRRCGCATPRLLNGCGGWSRGLGRVLLATGRGAADELAGLLPLLGVDRFDRRTLNRALAAHAAAGTRAA